MTDRSPTDAPDSAAPDSGTPFDAAPNGAGREPARLETVPLLHRLQTRLALLILAVVAVLAGATAIQLTRAFEQARIGVVQLTQAPANGAPSAGTTATGNAQSGATAKPQAAGTSATTPAAAPTATTHPLELRAIVRSTLINLAAIFLFTLVGATLFSRGLLTEPIAELVRGTRKLAAGELGVTLPVTSRSELGLLAEAFNHMSGTLSERTHELVTTNEALSVSEARYQLAIQGSNDGLWDWDVAGGGMYYAPRWAGLLGLDEAALKPSIATWYDLTHPDDLPALRDALGAHVAGAAPTFQLEHRLRHADGRWLWVLARGAALRGEDGRALRVAGSITDITERVEAVSLLERRVAERTADLAALLELSNSTALTLELGPLLAQILERLEAAVACRGATVFEHVLEGELRRVAGRGGEPARDAALLQRALATREPQSTDGAAGALLAVPLVVRDAAVGALLVAQGRCEPEPAADERSDRRQLTVAFANQLGVALENARLYQQVQERAASEERQHLARELHDSVSQALYAILLGTHTAQRKLEASPDDAHQALDYVETLAQAGIKEMRALIFVLRPESLEEEGLVGVLHKQLDVLESRHGIDAVLDAPLEPDAPFAVKQALYRIAQEALHNVVKHARAQQVRVSLAVEGGQVHLSVEDDGQGFDPGSDFPGHLGLRSMEERARGVQGVLHVTSTPGGGTRVSVDAPCGSAGARAESSSGGASGVDDAGAAGGPGRAAAGEEGGDAQG